MPRFEPFRGLRYDTGRVDLSRVTSPPYDVIGPEERARLAGRHSANAVHVDVPEPDHRANLDRYANAAVHLQTLRADGILVGDPTPSFYAYRMTAGDGQTTNGVIGALGIDRASRTEILPHEQTLSTAKSDRLDLMRATHANLSPLWGLSMSPDLTTTVVRTSPPDAVAVDDDGVRHELWAVSDPAALDTIRESVAGAPMVLADGHHRFETAVTYRAEVGSGPVGSDGFGDADAVMALVTELAPGELTVGPIHRGLSGLPDGLDLVDAFSSWFDVTRVGEPTERTVAALGESGALALVMPSGAWLLSPKDGTPEAAGSPLDSSMVALVIAELPDHELEFHHRWQDAAEAVLAERAQAVVLLRPVAVDQIAEWARAGRQMPPKTTYFHPKPRTGMVFRTLEG